ncbi:class I SAM-dependent methyltransferase, partial [Candidatus Bathyarchaeota archaeon]|nr:class I SAM-dependent methyltransferase [Candidatus Bathyarchaeota archaeon]
TFLDLGCGNGTLLSALRLDGWTGRLLGVDYSAQSVELARRVAQQEDSGAEFAQWDLLNDDYSAVLNGEQKGGWDVVTDKGTFDAISLSAQTSEGHPAEKYRARITPLLRPGGIFIVTSCNWTEDELRLWFGGEGAGFEEVGRIEYRSFSFGGHKGQTISTLCFRKT